MSALRGWNAQDDEDLLHLANEGFQLDSMAWALNRTPGRIRARLVELHWRPSPVADDPGRLPETTRRGASERLAQVGPRKMLGF